MEKEMLKYLRELAEDSVLKGIYVIEFEGVRLVMRSKKSSWETVGAAKNSLRHEIPHFYRECPDDYRDKIKVIKDLEAREVIKYVKID